MPCEPGVQLLPERLVVRLGHPLAHKTAPDRRLGIEPDLDLGVGERAGGLGGHFARPKLRKPRGQRILELARQRCYEFMGGTHFDLKGVVLVQGDEIARFDRDRRFGARAAVQDLERPVFGEDLARTVFHPRDDLADSPECIKLGRSERPFRTGGELAGAQFEPAGKQIKGRAVESLQRRAIQLSARARPEVDDRSVGEFNAKESALACLDQVVACDPDAFGQREFRQPPNRERIAFEDRDHADGLGGPCRRTTEQHRGRHWEDCRPDHRSPHAYTPCERAISTRLALFAWAIRFHYQEYRLQWSASTRCCGAQIDSLAAGTAAETGLWSFLRCESPASGLWSIECCRRTGQHSFRRSIAFEPKPTKGPDHVLRPPHPPR